jgi:hypothetical protein
MNCLTDAFPTFAGERPADTLFSTTNLSND